MKHPGTPSLLSIADLARRLQLPESTTRYYCKRFAAHLPHEGEGRRRRYRSEAVEILSAIAKSMRQNKNALAVDFALQASAREPVPQIRLPQPAEPVSGLSAQIMALMERQTQALQQIAAAMTLFVSGNPAAPTAFPVGSEETETLRNALGSLRDELQAAEEAHQKELDQIRKWLARFTEAMASRSA